MSEFTVNNVYVLYAELVHPSAQLLQVHFLISLSHSHCLLADFLSICFLSLSLSI